MNRFTYDTKKPLGSPTGFRALAIVMILIITFIYIKLLPTTLPRIVKNEESNNVLIYPFFLLILPIIYPLEKWINLHVIHYKEFQALKKVIQSAQLVDYDDKNKTSIFSIRQVIAGAKVMYKKLANGNIEVTFYPNGIKNSDRVSQLTDRLQEAFGLTVISIDKQLTHTTYLLGYISLNKKEVNDNDF
ncbi:hypothetical protein RON43_01760 [Lactobacillus gasseri]|uniref:hypothetical protein n=1 Tax=Lactobacillus gasseri TaxID=1596 RepID=UPI00254E0F49|nr:hypothetical protein [Lactobacillus gasseri]MCT7704997.1 hypothetical protein [Lactobacillus gasseri]MDK6499920.1 hypothetical protein [Lactobacillus gasseri]MDT9589885.1 hypothetical protein [Lactobacillus gasseri]MDT9611077.1 hypothetical protein [Lactobacillus gasseri]